MSKRYSNALYIQEGAVNPRAVARRLAAAIDEVCGEGGHPAASEDPAVRLIMHQLAYILWKVDLYDLPVKRTEGQEYYGFLAYGSDTDECRAKVSKGAI